MEYLQYEIVGKVYHAYYESFKPYYKWNTFNTEGDRFDTGAWPGF